MTRPFAGVGRGRIALGLAGVVLAGFGVFRLLTQVSPGDLAALLGWLAAAVLLHDGVLSPLLVAVGWCLGRFVPPRARRYVQATLIVGGLLTATTLTLVVRTGSQPRAKAVLDQDYAVHLAWLWGGVAIGCSLLYLVRVLRDARTESASRPSSLRGARGSRRR